MIDLQPDLSLTTAQAEHVLRTWLGAPVVCSTILPLRGGLVNTVFRLEFDRPPHCAVIKLHGLDGDNFTEEARALEYLGAETSCPVPSVYLCDCSGRLIPYAFLLMEELRGVCLDSLELAASERAHIDTQIADILGDLHDHKGSTWGALDSDDPPATWVDLFGARLTEARNHPALAECVAPETLDRIDDAIELSRSELCAPGLPTLVHGDVWDGNVMVRRDENRWRVTGLLDPDLQFADVEFELAYQEVFDVERAAFFAAYRNHQELRPGYERRRHFYWLYTALVHVALFGDDFFCRYAARTAETIVR